MTNAFTAAPLHRSLPSPEERRQPQTGGRGTRALTVAPGSYNASARTVEAVLSAGSPVRRFFYTEELEISATAIDLGRVERGICPLLDTHNQYEVDAVLGRIASVRIVAGELIGVIQFADSDRGREIEARVVAGDLRAISIGYQPTGWQMIEVDDKGHETWRATAWELLEASLVPVPADPNAVVRSASGADHGAANEEDSMFRRNLPGDAAGNDDQPPVRGRPITVARIHDLCGRTDDLSRAFERDILREHDDRPFTETALRERISAELISVRARPGIDVRQARGDQAHPASQLVDRMTGALYARMSGRPPEEAAREFMGATVADMARGIMEARGERVRWHSAGQVLDAMQRAGAHATSDFPSLLGGATQRYLLDIYNASPSPLRALSRARVVNDFRQITALKMLAFGMLHPVKENGEFKRVTISESINGYKLATFGDIFGLTRQAFINDDLGYFSQMATVFGRAAAETEANVLVSLITANGPSLPDETGGGTHALYDAAHGNLAASGAAITVASLSEARLAMRGQKNLDGTVANVVPRYLVVGPAKETEGEQALAVLDATSPSGVNPFSGRLELVVEPRITGNSWRLFADPMNSPVLEYAQLAGQEGLFTDQRIGFDVDGIEFKARLDFGAGVLDYRGTFKNPGN